MFIKDPINPIETQKRMKHWQIVSEKVFVETYNSNPSNDKIEIPSTIRPEQWGRRQELLYQRFLGNKDAYQCINKIFELL